MGLNFAFIRSLHRASPVAFGAMDLVDNDLIYSSGHAEKLLGYTQEELQSLSSKYFESIVHPDDLAISRNAIKTLQNSQVGEIVECSLRVRGAKGTYKNLFIRDVVFERDESDKPLKFTTVVQDITDLVKLESELAEKVASLKEISFKNSHELRAPVANIIALVRLMKNDNFKTEYNERIFHHLEETVERLDQVIHEINDLSN